MFKYADIKSDEDILPGILSRLSHHEDLADQACAMPTGFTQTSVHAMSQNEAMGAGSRHPSVMRQDSLNSQESFSARSRQGSALSRQEMMRHASVTSHHSTNSRGNDSVNGDVFLPMTASSPTPILEDPSGMTRGPVAV